MHEAINLPWICCSSAWEASSYRNRISHEVLESSNNIGACLPLWLLILKSRIILQRIRLEKHQRTLLQQAQAWRRPLLLLSYILPWNEQLHSFGSSVEGEGPNNKLKEQLCVLTAWRSLYTSNLHSIIESCKLFQTSWACYFWHARVWLFFFLSRFHGTQLIYVAIFTQIVKCWFDLQLMFSTAEYHALLQNPSANTACRHANVSSHGWDIQDNNKFILEHLVLLVLLLHTRDLFHQMWRAQSSGQERASMSNTSSSAFLSSGLQYGSWLARETWGLNFSKDSSDTGCTIGNKKSKQEPSEETATQSHLPIDPYTRCHILVMKAIWHCLFPTIIMHLLGHNLLSCECWTLNNQRTVLSNLFLTSLFTSIQGCIPAISSAFFAIEHLHWEDPCLCVAATWMFNSSEKSPSIFKVHFNNLFSNVFSIATSIPMNSANNKQQHPHSTFWFQASWSSYPLLLCRWQAWPPGGHPCKHSVQCSAVHTFCRIRPQPGRFIPAKFSATAITARFT